MKILFGSNKSNAKKKEEEEVLNKTEDGNVNGERESI